MGNSLNLKALKITCNNPCRFTQAFIYLYIGLMSSDWPSLFVFLFRATSLPPAKYADTILGALPDAKILTIPCKEAEIGVWRATQSASSKFCTEIPKVPAEVPLGKDLKMLWMSNVELRATGSRVPVGVVVGPIFCHCSLGTKVNVQPHLGERFYRYVGIGNSSLFQRWKDTIWEHEEL